MVAKSTPLVQGIVLAGVYPGGSGALDSLAPRPLLPVAERPLIHYSLLWMRDAGLRSATICTNSGSRPVRAHLQAAGLEMSLDYAEDWNPRGAAGCVRDAALRSQADTIVVADGTSVPVVDAEELLAAHRASGAALTVVVAADAAGRLQPTGVYVFARRCFAHVPEEGFQDIKERLLPRLYETGETVSMHIARELSPRVTNTSSYLALNQWAIERSCRQAPVAEGFQLVGETLVHETARVEVGAVMLGPVIVGPRAVVHADATLVGPLSIGPGTSVAPGAVVCRSVAWSGCLIGEGAFVDRCVLADDACVEPRRSIHASVEIAPRRSRLSGQRQRRRFSLAAPEFAPLRPAPSRQP